MTLKDVPSLLDSSCTRPFRHVSLTSPMLVAQRPMAWIVAATKSLSMLLMYVYQRKYSLSIVIHEGSLLLTNPSLLKERPAQFFFSTLTEVKIHP